MRCQHRKVVHWI